MPTDTITRTKTNLHLKEPCLYRVVYLNDDVTSMEFVIESLVSVFKLTVDQAEALTHKIHEEGSAVVAVLPYEIAEQKGIEVTVMAKNQGYPLVVKLESDD
jgi:ATP-dependent Clp protease adaptor protein ClpS